MEREVRNKVKKNSGRKNLSAAYKTTLSMVFFNKMKKTFYKY